MITRAKLDEYIWADGDIDGYARSGRRGDISDQDWFLIDEMLSAISMIRRGLAADSFTREHQARVQEVFESEDTYNFLVEYEANGESGRRE